MHPGNVLSCTWLKALASGCVYDLPFLTAAIDETNTLLLQISLQQGGVPVFQSIVTHGS